ncbi:GPI biosynthesis protein Pig-F [Geopyxis carbonaria]|nr:GPI biosynthesis protein Pig-F [Geopyxis carbonaria]
MPPSQIAAMATHVHTAVLASSYYLLFPSLIAEPSSTLLQTLPALAALQTVYCLSSLPVSKPSSPSPSAASSTTSAKRPAKTRRTGSALTNNLTPALLSLSLASTLGTVVLTVLLVLFGAPATTHHAHTLGAAAHMALLVVFPLVYRYGVDGARWRVLVGVQAAMEEAVGGAMGACLGAWLGAVPIPLDWDREWQRWPVTVITGAYMGYVVGKSAGGLWRGRKLPF